MRATQKRPPGAAQKRLETIAKAHAKAQDRANQTRAELHAAILAAIDDGVRQVDIARVTGYTRERIRQIDRERENAS